MNPNGSDGDNKNHISCSDEQKRTTRERLEEEDEDEVERDLTLRIFACDLIQNAGILLRLPQVALATAQMLLQRAYHTTEFTFGKHHLDITAMACLFLAAKIEEDTRRAREIIDVFTNVIACKMQRILTPRKPDDTQSHLQHERVREELITAEKRLLKTLGFDLLSNYPHKMIVTFYHAILDNLDREGNFWQEHDIQEVLQRAWNYCNDCLRLDIFTDHSNEAVACACIHMACEDTKKYLPRSTDGRQWYCLFVKDDLEVLESIRIIQSLYKRKRLEPTKIVRYLHLTGSGSGSNKIQLCEFLLWQQQEIHQHQQHQRQQQRQPRSHSGRHKY